MSLKRECQENVRLCVHCTVYKRHLAAIKSLGKFISRGSCTQLIFQIPLSCVQSCCITFHCTKMKIIHYWRRRWLIHVYSSWLVAVATGRKRFACDPMLYSLANTKPFPLTITQCSSLVWECYGATEASIFRGIQTCSVGCATTKQKPLHPKNNLYEKR